MRTKSAFAGHRTGRSLEVDGEQILLEQPVRPRPPLRTSRGILDMGHIAGSFRRWRSGCSHLGDGGLAEVHPDAAAKAVSLLSKLTKGSDAEAVFISYFSRKELVKAAILEADVAATGIRIAEATGLDLTDAITARAQS